MTTTSQQAVVTCADSVSVIYSEFGILKTVVAAITFVGFVFLGLWMHALWLGVVGILLIASFLVVPHVFRIHRFLSSLPCPVCGLPAGRYISRISRIYIRCKHCGHEAPTDCKFLYAGGPPIKL